MVCVGNKSYVSGGNCITGCVSCGLCVWLGSPCPHRHHQRLPTGTHVLAAIRSVDKNKLVLALPHGVTAVARAVDINRIAARVAELDAPAASSSSGSDSSEEDEGK